MINLKTNELTIKKDILDGNDIIFIKTDKRNKCIVIAYYRFD